MLGVHQPTLTSPFFFHFNVFRKDKRIDGGSDFFRGGAPPLPSFIISFRNLERFKMIFFGGEGVGKFSFSCFIDLED